MMFTGSKDTEPNAGNARQILAGERVVILYARIALGAAFLSAVADRFGLWGRYGGWGNFANFEKYTAQVNSFMPAFIVPFLADRDRGRIVARNRTNYWCLDPMGCFRICRTTLPFWYSHGPFFWH